MSWSVVLKLWLMNLRHLLPPTMVTNVRIIRPWFIHWNGLAQSNGITYSPQLWTDQSGKFHNWAAYTWHWHTDIILCKAMVSTRKDFNYLCLSVWKNFLIISNANTCWSLLTNFQHGEGLTSRLCFYQTRSAWSVDLGSNKNHSPAYNFAPTVTKFCVMWEGLSLPHDTKFGNCRYKIVDSRAFPSWSLIHGLRWSGLIKTEPGNINMSWRYNKLISY